MADKLAILIWAATPDHPQLIATPLVHALAARALDAEVEIHFSGPAIRWLVEGVADHLYTSPSCEKTAGDFLREAQEAGARLYACGMARAAWVASGESFIPQVGAAGATAFVARTLDPAWKTLTY